MIKTYIDKIIGEMFKYDKIVYLVGLIVIFFCDGYLGF